MTMTREQRFDRDLVLVLDSGDTADRADCADTNDPREDPLRQLREYLARPIQAWELDHRTWRPELLRAHFPKRPE
jgi:hypothetical protein